MRILIFSHTGRLGGAELCLLEALKVLSSTSNEVHVIFPSRGELVARCENIKVATHILPYPWWATGSIDLLRSRLRALKDIRNFLGPILKLKKILEHIQPELVLTNTVVIPYGAIIAKFMKIPHIWWIHEFLEEDHDMSFIFGKWLSLKLVNSLSTSVILNSISVYNKYVKFISKSKLRLLYCSADIPKDLESSKKIMCSDGFNKKCFHILLLGHKTPGKRQEDAIKAVGILLKKGLNVHLWLVGDESRSYTEYLHKLTQSLEIEDSVDFVNFTNDPTQYIRAASVVLICSICEAFGRVTIEAMKCSKVVIGSDSCGTSELIKNGSNGLLYKPGCFEMLADKIELLYFDEPLRKEIERNAYHWANDNFNPIKFSNDLNKILDELKNKVL